jgi:hypothetical protein
MTHNTRAAWLLPASVAAFTLSLIDGLGVLILLSPVLFVLAFLLSPKIGQDDRP